MVTRKYFRTIFCQDVKSYIKGCEVYLALKAVCHKPYGDLYLLPVLNHCWKELSIDFVTGFLLSITWKSNSYNSILVIIDCLIKKVYYKLIKTIINVAKPPKDIIKILVRQHGLLESIVSNHDFLFILKFWFLLCYFLSIKQKLLTAFCP